MAESASADVAAPVDSAQLAFDMVVIGGTGDLAQRKLLPALFFLHKQEALSPSGRIICVARQDWKRSTYVKTVKKSCRKYIEETEFSEDVWSTFAESLYYLGMSATDESDYGPLIELLTSVPAPAQTGARARIFYLATPPDLYGPISHTLHAVGLVDRHTRIVLEKPIGHDLPSSREINATVGEVFSENQIFRIDHYLGKETVQNLMALRFGNALLEPLWNSDRIDHVQITVAEDIGIEGRGSYYDHAGALRDMVQNHLLQLLCLVAMEPPASMDQEAVRIEKIKVLRALRPIRGEEVLQKTVRGQYAAGAINGAPVVGYQQEEDVEDKSRTETFVALKVEIENWRWAGVPFYLRTGKRMTQRVSEIVLHFKRVPHVLFDSGEMEDNRLVIRLQPDENIRLGMNVKLPGAGMTLEPVFLDLDLRETFDSRTPYAYERLLMDVIRGNPTLFMHRAEVEEAWRWVDPILQAWQVARERPRSYVAGTWGPSESVAMIVRDDREWDEPLG